MLLVMKIRKNIQSTSQKRFCEDEHDEFLLTGEWEDFNTFVYDCSLHVGRKHFRCYCLRAFSAEEILNFILKIDLKLLVKNVNMLN